jgi:hypothetical protein
LSVSEPALAVDLAVHFGQAIVTNVRKANNTPDKEEEYDELKIHLPSLLSERPRQLKRSIVLNPALRFHKIQ